MKDDAFKKDLMLHEQQKLNDQQLEEYRKKHMEKCLGYQQVFKSDTGADILEDLRNLFFNAASFEPGRNLNDVCYFEGQKSVVRYIDQLVKFKLVDGKQPTS